VLIRDVVWQSSKC